MGSAVKLKLILLTLIMGSLPTLSLACDILLLGDSISSGYGITSGKSWANLLEQKLNLQHPNIHFRNLSVSGYTSKMALGILKKTLENQSAQIIIVEIGGNDALRGISPDTFAKNMLEIEQLAKAQNATLVILGIRLPPNIPKSYRQAHSEVYAGMLKVHLGTNEFMDDVIANDLFQTDRIHPNTAAQIYLLERAWPSIEQALEQQKEHCE